MISLFRPAPASGWEYREAWYDVASEEFVIHHGQVGANGTVTAEKVPADDVEALLESFTARCSEDGYRDPAADETHEVLISYPLKGRTPAAAEQRNADTVHAAVLTALAWRGLGALTDPEPETREGGTDLVMRARTLHRRKALDAIRSAVKSTDVPPSKVRARTS